MRTLVTGATGTVGRLVVQRLLEREEQVRALTRRPGAAQLPAGVEVVGGDLADPSSIPASVFDDVDRVFVFPAQQGVAELVATATAAGADRLVVLSSLAAAAEHERDLRSVSHHHHVAVERAVAERTDRWTFLRPGTFATNLLAWAPAIRAGAPVRAPYAQSVQAPVHEADVADVAVAVLTGDGHDGRALPLTGPQALSRVEQVRAIARGIGRDIAFEEVTPEDFRRGVERFLPEEVITMLLDHWSDTVTAPDVVRTTVQDLTGQPGRTLQQWASDHRADFGAARG